MLCIPSSNSATRCCRERDLSHGWRMRQCVQQKLPVAGFVGSSGCVKLFQLKSEYLENLMSVTRRKMLMRLAQYLVQNLPKILLHIWCIPQIKRGAQPFGQCILVAVVPPGQVLKCHASYGAHHNLFLILSAFGLTIYYVT